MNAIILRNPHALLLPSIEGLLRRAVGSLDIIGPAGFDSTASDFYAFVTDPSHFFILGADAENTPQAVALLGLPSSTLFPYPTIYLIYNEGGPALRRLVKQTMLDICIQYGYTKAWGINTSGYPDSVWERAMTPQGGRARRLGSVYEFSVEAG